MNSLQGLSLALTCSLLVTDASANEGAKPYISPNGTHCFECPPGTFVKEHCTEDLTNSTCQTCPGLHYRDKSSGLTFCQLCRPDCPKNSDMVEKCKPTADTLCICREGFHMHPLDRHDPRWKCRPHFKCQRGQGKESNHTHNTVCENCTSSQFVNTSDPVHPVCQDCRICEPGSEEIRICSLDGDRQCGDNSTASYTEMTSTPPPVTNDSGSLSAGETAGVVVGVLLVLIFFIIAVVIFVRRKKKQRQPTPRTGEEGESMMRGTTDDIPARNGEARRSNGVPAANGTDPRSSASDDAGFQGAEGMEMENSPNSSSDSGWTEDFMIRRVFPFLADNLGNEWSFFIRQLPGWPSTRTAQTTIEHKTEEQLQVKGRTYECLMEWRRQCSAECFTKDSILNTLQRDGVKRNDLREDLESMQIS